MFDKAPVALRGLQGQRAGEAEMEVEVDYLAREDNTFHMLYKIISRA